MRRKFISKIILGTMISTTLFTLVPVTASAEWVTDYQNNRYYTQNNKKLTGWKRIDGQLYYFDDNGKMQTGWINAGKSWYLLQNSGVLKTGWINYNKNLYYADSSGVMQTGIINIGGKVYILEDNGVLKTSNTIIDGQFYTIGLDGEVVGSKVPTPDKEFDTFGNYVAALKNTDKNVITSPTDSSFNDVIEDESDANADEEEYYGVEYTVKYKDSSGEILKTKTVKKGKSVEVYEPTKVGYNFGWWDTKSDGSGKNYSTGDDVKVNKDLTLYAQWTEDTTAYVEGITVTGSSNVVINKTTQMTAKVLPSDAANTNVTWSVTSGTGSATISSDGLLTGVSNGTVTVKATSKDGSNISSTKEVTVSDTEIIVPATEVSVNSESGAIKITTSAGTLQMTGSVSPTTATNQEIIWSVDKRTGSATISSDGLLTAESNGTVTVVATVANTDGVISGSKTITITGQSAKVSVEDIIVSGEDGATTIEKNSGTLQMSGTVVPSWATNRAFKWSVESVSDEKTGLTGKATISDTGILTALANGIVTVKATSIENSEIVGTKEITISEQTKKVTEIIVTGKDGAEEITTTGAAATLQMEAELLPVDVIEDYTWSVEQAGDTATDMTGKAEIDKNGLLTAVSNGKVRVKATTTNGTKVYGSTVIEISGRPTKVTAIELSTEGGTGDLETNGGINLTLQMNATITPSNATDKSIVWSVKAPSGSLGSADIDKNGLLTAKTNGTVLVTATADGGTGISRSKLITISGQIETVEKITVAAQYNYTTITKDKGTLQMSATVTPSTATNKAVYWSVNNKDGSINKYATISDTGLLTAVSNGIVIVTATAQDGTAIFGTSKEIEISGQKIKITKMEITIGNVVSTIPVTVVKGGTLEMGVNILPVDADDKTVTWTVAPGGTGTVTINGFGVLTASSVGTVTVVATANDSSGISTFKVITITEV